MRKILPAAPFILFSLIVVVSFLFYAPGWGFMDDLSCRQLAGFFWSGKASFASLIREDIHVYGRFRPVYYVWIISVYWCKYPLLIYLAVFLIGFYMLSLWGELINRIIFKDPAHDYVKWVLPLGFFLFPAFWNIFMYISVQEKFIFAFGSLSLFSLFKSYEKESLRHLVTALVLAMFAALGKETGIVFFILYAMYALLDLILFKRNNYLSRILIVVSLIIVVAYGVFIKRIIGMYTASYKANMSIGVLLGRFFMLSGVIKLILAISVISFLIFIWDTLRGRKLYDSLFVVFPLFIFVYTFLLLPWRFPAYLLAPMGPFIIICVYFLVARLARQQFWPVQSLGIVIIAGAMLTLALDIIPKISKMADKRKVVQELRYLDQEARGQFFYPKPFEETADSLRGFSLARVIYVDTINASSLGKGNNNYLVINDEAGAVLLNGVDVGQQLYHSGTWGIWLLHKAADVHKEFRLVLPQNILQKIKNMIRRG
ncbi:MAG: hypothetical protein HQL12_01760 [Candidatus Omnitrophica bacterium]|nr:hypothetical protein [Candidatus Omnitrophota bacterium]